MTNESPSKITFMNCVYQAQLRFLGIAFPSPVAGASSQDDDHALSKGKGRCKKSPQMPDMEKVGVNSTTTKYI
jgi:hypothetical protein